MRVFLVVAVSVILSTSACTPSQVKDTKTIHNADASRIWVIQRAGDTEHVVMCDVELFKSPARQLCVRWPQ